ncbi:hypothetical protein B7494_g6734 [Chlorociboria aeruginascens]|nr:hypothetical protein B7494_g6734 [Chlorociboria aeruginascens]
MSPKAKIDPRLPEISCILLTGATGFLGKVVLEELLRRRDEYNLQKVFLITRSKKGCDPESRFREKLSTSPCFSKLPRDWKDSVEVVQGELSLENCGLDENTYKRISVEITHIIHCAASTDFELSVGQAASANITTSLNICELARSCPYVRRLVVTSTAYVTPHTLGPIRETLVPLFRPAAMLLEDIESGNVADAEILRITGHPNTYTLTKCIAEHLVLENRGHVPVTIIRPSIISASRQYPFPGWIDSNAAFAGFITMFSTGFLHVINGNPDAVLDIVPVDRVARQLIDEALLGKHDPEDSAIVYAVASLKNSTKIKAICSAVEDFFGEQSSGTGPQLYYIGPQSWRYSFHYYAQEKLPLLLARAYSGIWGDIKAQKALDRVTKMILTLNRVFPYFLQNTFDFRPRAPLEDFESEEYLRTLFGGIHRHLCKGGD